MSEFRYEINIHSDGKNILTRCSDGAICYLTDEDANLIMAIEDTNDFNLVASTFTFIDLMLEREI